jgi:hypothetical protein
VLSRVLVPKGIIYPIEKKLMAAICLESVEEFLPSTSPQPDLAFLDAEYTQLRASGDYNAFYCSLLDNMVIQRPVLNPNGSYTLTTTAYLIKLFSAIVFRDCFGQQVQAYDKEPITFRPGQTLDIMEIKRFVIYYKNGEQIREPESPREKAALDLFLNYKLPALCIAISGRVEREGNIFVRAVGFLSLCCH